MVQLLQSASGRVRQLCARLFTFASGVQLLDIFLQLHTGLLDHPVLLRSQERASGGDAHRLIRRPDDFVLGV